MLFSSSRKHLWPNRFGHLRRQLFDKLLEPRWEVGVCALDLILGICEKGFKVTIGGGYTICKVFKDKSKPKEWPLVYLKLLVVKRREVHTFGGALEILSKQRIRGC